MTDKNGTEIKTGDIVEITGAFFKAELTRRPDLVRQWAQP